MRFFCSIRTTNQDSNSERNCNIFDSVRMMSDIAYRGSSWRSAAETESEHLGGNKIFENAKSGNIFEVGNSGRKNSVIWNHKDSNSIHTDKNHTNSNKIIPYDYTNIVSINDLTGICAMEKIFPSPVNLVRTPSTVHAPQIFIYWTSSDSRSSSYESSAETVTPKGNPTPRNNPTNMVPNVPDDPESNPGLSYSSSSDSSDLSDNDYSKQVWRTKKNNINKCWSKTCFRNPIKKWAKCTAKILTAMYTSKVICSNLMRMHYSAVFYFLYFINSLKIVFIII